MSLIVGRANKGRVIILGDTKLTFHNNKYSNPYVDGCLKLYAVSDSLAFGFAGIVEQFEIALPSLLACKSANEIANTALELKIEKKLDFDLLIGEVGAEFLTILKGAEISQQVIGYVGDKDAFEEFQSNFNEVSLFTGEEARAYIQISRLPEPVWEDDVYLKMFNAFKKTLISSKLVTVGGIAIPLCTDNGKFRYMCYVDIISDPLDISQFSNGPKTIEFGTAAYGAFSVELCDTSPYGGSPYDIGFYFLQGGFGLVFCENSNKLKQPKVVLADNPAYWVLNSSFEYGVGVGSGYMTPDHCGIAGEQLLSSGNWTNALFCYELTKDAIKFSERPAVYDRFMSGYAVALFNCGKIEDAFNIIKNTLKLNASSPLCSEYLTKFLAVTKKK